MIYLIIALAAVLAGAGFLGWRLYSASKALAASEARCKALQKERAQRENLQMILDSRTAENRRLKGRLHKLEDDMEAMEQEASQLNLNLSHESGLRILREKEEGARRMKMDLMERQLDQANERLKQQQRQAREANERLNQVIDEQRQRIEQQQKTIEEQQNTIEQLSAPAPMSRRAARRREGLPNQVTLDDLLSD